MLSPIWAVDAALADVVMESNVGLEKKAKAAQLSVLSRYDVLADFSGEEEAVLDRILKGKVAIGAAQAMTFAGWCDEMLGLGRRVPVARFDDAVTGQTRISTLALGLDLAKSLKARDKLLTAPIKGHQQHIQQLQDQLRVLTHQEAAALESEASGRLRYWYGDATERLQVILWDIKDIEGPIHEYQGHSNRDYRQLLLEIILDALSSLDHLGFFINVKLQDASDKTPVPAPVTLHRGQPLEGDPYDQERFSFEVKDVQADMLDAASARVRPWQALDAIDQQTRFNCRVEVAVSKTPGLGEGELLHLSCYLHKLFETLARSGDSRPRGTLRETVILCLLLAWTAPCMPARNHRQQQQLLGLQDTFYRDIRPKNSDKSRAASDVSAGQIVEHLLRIMRVQIQH